MTDYTVISIQYGNVLILSVVERQLKKSLTNMDLFIKYFLI